MERTLSHCTHPVFTQNEQCNMIMKPANEKITAEIGMSMQQPSLGKKLLLPKVLHAAGFFASAQQAISTNKRC